MKRKGIGLIIALTTVLAACAPAATTTETKPITTVPTTSATTTAPATTKPVEKPQYGGTLNLVMIADISSWDQGLTGC